MAGVPVIRPRLSAVVRPIRPLFVLTILLALTLCAYVCAQDAEPADNNADERFRELRKLYHENAEKAVKGFREFIEQHPENDLLDEARYWLAMSLDRAKAKPEQIVEAYQSLIDKHPKSEWADDALFAIAEIKARQARQKEDCSGAIEAYEKFIAQYPESERLGEAKLQIGELCRRMGKSDEAIASYRRVLTEHADSPFASRARMQLARELARCNRLNEALAEYRTLLTSPLADRERVEAGLGVVDIYLKQEDGLDKAVAEAREIRDEATRRNALEDYAEFATRARLAGFYMAKGRFEDAENEYRAYVSRFETSVGVWQANLNIGIIRVEAKKYPQAREMFAEIIRKFSGEPGRPPWYFTRALYYDALSWELEGNVAKARELYGKIIEKYADTYDARLSKGRLERIEKAEKEKAEKDAKEKEGEPKK